MSAWIVDAAILLLALDFPVFTGVLEGFYYECKGFIPAHKREKLNLELYSTKIKGKKRALRYDKAIMVAIRAIFYALMFWAIEGHWFAKVSFVAASLMVFVLLHDAAVNWGRYYLGNEKYKEWWKYVSSTDTSIIRETQAWRLAMLFCGLWIYIIYFGEKL